MKMVPESQVADFKGKNTPSGAVCVVFGFLGWCCAFQRHHPSTTQNTTPNLLFLLNLICLVVLWCCRFINSINIKEKERKAQKQVGAVSESHRCDSIAPQHHLASLGGVPLFLSLSPLSRLTQKLRGAS